MVVPADPAEEVRVIDLAAGGSTLANLQREVGGNVEVQAHPEADLWLNDEGRLIDLPINVRANHWMLNDSERSKAGTVGESTVMYGDVVVTGPPDQDGDVTAVSDELVRRFQGMRLDVDAVKDWDVRSVGWYITDWPEAPTDGPDQDLSPDF